MITSLALRWALTILFVVCTGLYGRQAIGARAWPPRLAWWLHVLMAVAMIAMAWPAGMGIPTLLYVPVFTVGALYFVYLGVFGPAVNHSFYHAVMMAAMVAMAVVMPSAMSGMSATPGVPGMSAMPDMPMAGAGVAHAAGSAAPPAWVSVLCGLAAAFFLGVALWSFVVLIRGPQRSYANLLMTLGMGVTFAAMAT